MTSVYTKYWILAIITALISLLTYFQNQTMLTEATYIGAALVLLPLIAHDFENQPKA